MIPSSSPGKRKLVTTALSLHRHAAKRILLSAPPLPPPSDRPSGRSWPCPCEHASHHLACLPGRRFSASSRSPSPPALSPSLLVPHPPGSPLDRYVQQLRAGKLRPDIRQETTMKRLQTLWQQLEAWDGSAYTPTEASTASPPPARDDSGSNSNGGLFSLARRFGGLLSSRNGESSASSDAGGSSSSSSGGPKGFYMYGGAGCGKTMMMNLLYDSLSSRHKGRDHFHHFMLHVHQQLHALRASAQHSNPLATIASSYAQHTRILCLDEFQVTDVADAMILRLLFASLWQHSVVLIATSNRPPSDLYKNGINREVFVPFIAELSAHCHVHAMEDGQDHRLLGTVDVGVYHYPLDANADAQLDDIFRSLSLGETPQPASITVMMGRRLHVPLASKQAALFTFRDLCDQPLGAADYIAVANNYKYVLVRGIPLLKRDEREKIRRFITLLDVLYEHGTRLIVTAAARPRELFVDEDGRVLRPGSGTGAYDEGFASARAVSRLIEMQSAEYVTRHSQRNVPSQADEA